MIIPQSFYFSAKIWTVLLLQLSVGDDFFLLFTFSISSQMGQQHNQAVVTLLLGFYFSQLRGLSLLLFRVVACFLCENSFSVSFLATPFTSFFRRPCLQFLHRLECDELDLQPTSSVLASGRKRRATGAVGASSRRGRTPARGGAAGKKRSRYSEEEGDDDEGEDILAETSDEEDEEPEGLEGGDGGDDDGGGDEEESGEASQPARKKAKRPATPGKAPAKRTSAAKKAPTRTPKTPAASAASPSRRSGRSRTPSAALLQAQAAESDLADIDEEV